MHMDKELSPILKFNDKVIRLIKEHSSIVWIKTYDFESIDDFFRLLSSEDGFVMSSGESFSVEREKILTWSVATGQVLFDKPSRSCNIATKLSATLEAFCTHYNDYDVDEDKEFGFQLLILKDIFQLLQPGMEDSTLIISQLQNFAHWNNKQCNRKQTILIISPIYEKIAGLENLIEFLEDPIPDEKDIRRELGFDYFDDEENGKKRLLKVIRERSGYTHGRYHYSRAFMETYSDINKKLVSALLGMHIFDIRKVLYSLQVHGRSGKLYPKDGESHKFLSERISDEKKRIVHNSGLLQVIDISQDQKDKIGNIRNLRILLNTQKNIIDNIEKYPANLPKPKGVLLVGAPGCGKSEAAKSIASILEKPLLRLDIGALMGQYVGVSENNLIEAIKIAEAAQPCVLWIDEIEKAFAGFSNSDTGNDITVMRMVGYFLTWMQERKSLVYLVATANNLDDLRPELLRKGRWDKIMYLSYPDKRGIVDIFYRCLQKYELKLLDNYIDDLELQNKILGISNINERIEKLTDAVIHSKGLFNKVINKIYDQEMSGADIDNLIVEVFNRRFSDATEHDGDILSLPLDSFVKLLSETNTLQSRKDASDELIKKGMLNFKISSGRFDLDEKPDDMLQQFINDYRLSSGNLSMDRSDDDLEDDAMLEIKLSQGKAYIERENEVKKLVRDKIKKTRKNEETIKDLLEKKIAAKEREKETIRNAFQEQYAYKGRLEQEKYYKTKGYEPAS